MSDFDVAGGGPAVPILFAAVRLPIAVLSEPAVLGLTAYGQIGAGAVVVRIPARQDADPELDTDDMALAIRNDRREPSSASGRVLRDWGDNSPPELGGGPVEVRRLLVRVDGASKGLPPPRVGVGTSLAARLSDELYRHGNRWHDVLRSWIETLTLQDLDHEHPRWTAHLEGAGIATFAADGTRRLGSGGRIRLDTEWPTAASPEVWIAALRGASADHYPHLAYLLLRDARAAWYRGQARRAVIDAATATEVALSGVAAIEGQRDSRRTMTLGTLVDTLRTAGHLNVETANQLMELVVRPRNKAVHEGVHPSSWNAAEACKAAQVQVYARVRL